MSRPDRIYLIRHAESAGNVDRSIYGRLPDWKVPLTDKGREQAAQAGLNVAAVIGTERLGVYVSPYVRTRQTWEGLGVPAKRVAFVKDDPRLREQEWGGNLRAYEHNKWPEIEEERDAYGTFYYRFMHGESGCDVFDRCTGFLDTLYRDFDKSTFPRHVLIVTHGFTMRVLLMRWLHLTVDEFHAMSNPPNGYMAELVKGSDERYSLAHPFPART